MDFLVFLYVVVCVILLFGAAVFIHEFGHFWVALKCGMKVEEFSIGFGPKITSWKRNGIEYSLRWIPAGGFVRLPQMVTSETLEGANEEPCPPAPPWKRILTAFAGPGMNLVFGFFLAIILYFVGLPILVNPPIIGPVDSDSPEYKMGIREDDLVTSMNNRKVSSWEDIMNYSIMATTNVVPVVTKRGETFFTNYLTLAPKDYLQANGIEWKFLNLDPKGRVEAMEVIAGGPGEQANLKNGDEIVSFNDKMIFGTQQLIEQVQANPGKPCKMIVRRAVEGGKEDKTQDVTLSITPADVGGIGKISVQLGLAQKTKMVYEVQKPGPLPWDRVWYVVVRTYDTIAALCNTSKTGVGAKDLSGPPGILAMLATYVKTDYRLALDFMILLNINLAILNLLPIPVLDGGHILMSIIEKVTGKTVNIKVLEYVNTAFALLLIGFMIFVSYDDIFRKGHLFKAMYTQDTQVQHSSESNDTNAPMEEK